MTAFTTANCICPMDILDPTAPFLSDPICEAPRGPKWQEDLLVVFPMKSEGTTWLLLVLQRFDLGDRGLWPRCKTFGSVGQYTTWVLVIMVSLSPWQPHKYYNSSLLELEYRELPSEAPSIATAVFHFSH